MTTIPVRGILCTDRISIIHNSSLLPLGSILLPIFDESKVFLLETLGEGGFGVVRKAYDKTANEFIALKKFKDMEKATAEKLEAIMVEHDLLQSVEKIRTNNEQNYQYFLKYDGIFISAEDSKDLILRMENGRVSLEDILKAGKRYPCEELIYVLRKIDEAFVILEQNGIANRDVKTGNIILVEDQREKSGAFYYKISDFGIGCKLEKGIQVIEANTISGVTKEYAAPEILRIFEKVEILSNIHYNPFVADVFSLGMVALKMINTHFGRTELNALSHKKLKLIGYEEIIPLLEGMVEEKPEKRWTFKKILEYLEEKKYIEKKPADEWEFCHKWQIEVKDKKMEKTYEKLQKLFEEHETMFFAYKNNVTRPKEAKFHLDRCKDILGKIQQIIRGNASREKICYLMEKKSIILKISEIGLKQMEI